MSSRKEIQSIINELIESNNSFSPGLLHFFSDINSTDLKEIQSIWEKIPLNRRIQLLTDLENLLEVDTLVNFDDLGKFALSDPDMQVRCQAIHLLWENDETSTSRILCDLLGNDPHEQVCAAAAYALGRFVLLGELEEIPRKYFDEVESLLLQTYHNNKSQLVRRKALEAIGYSSKPEVKRVIMHAIENTDPIWLTSALITMGRSANQDWEVQIKQHLSSPFFSVREEAIRAAGELELEGTRTILLGFLENEDTQDECWPTIIWALSQIGGEGVREKFEQLLEQALSEDEIEVIEMAIENLVFTEADNTFDIFNIG